MTMSTFNDAAQIDAWLAQAQGESPDAAEALYQRVIALDPNHPSANHQLGMLELRLGRPGALVRLATALKAAPAEQQYWLGYIGALIDSGETDAASQVLAMGRQRGLAGEAVEKLALRLAPAPVAASADEMAAVMALLAADQFDQADQTAQALTLRYPADAFGWKIQSAVHRSRNQLEQALQAMHQAARCAPDDPEAFANLAGLLIDLQRPAEAEAQMRHALSLKGDAEYWNTLGITLAGPPHHAEQAFRRSLELQPDKTEALNNLAGHLLAQSRIHEAVTLYRRALSLRPDFHQARSNLLFCLSQVDQVEPAALFKAHVAFGALVEGALRKQGKQFRQHANPPEPDKVLRIGFVSGDLRKHPVASFIEPLFATLAGRPRLELVAYFNFPTQDEVSARLRGHMGLWRDIFRQSDDAVADQIRADGIDILIDLSGHTAFNRLTLFALKPAPVQVTWIGYPGTTGMKAIDYCMVDRLLLPPGRFDGQYTEKLVHLAVGSPFQRESSAPPVNPLPALARGVVTFGSFNRMSKMSRAVVAVWARLLRALPDSRLLVGAMPEDDTGGALAGWLAEEGIAGDRLEFHRRSDVQTYLTLYHRIDICLDTFPYSGGTTTMHALTMGVPTLTIAGNTAGGRQSACIMGHAGFDDFVASDADDFVAKGVASCGRLEQLARMRASLGEQFSRNPAMHDVAVADSLQAALREMWVRWCAGKKPAAFEIK